MNGTQELLRIVEEAHSLARILDAATRVISLRLEVDGCSALLFDEHGQPVRGAASDVGTAGTSTILELSDASSVATALREACAA